MRRFNNGFLAGRLTSLVFGNGIGTAINLALSVLLARRLGPAEFVLASMLMLAVPLVSIAAGGVDSTAVRLLAEGESAGPVVRRAVLWRAPLTQVTACAIALLAWTAADEVDVSGWLVLGVACAVALAGTVYAPLMILPQAAQRYGTMSFRQLVVTAGFGAAALAGALASDVKLMAVAQIVCAGLICIVVAVMIGRTRLAEFVARGGLSADSRKKFDRWALAAVPSALAFVAFDRVDIFIAAARLGPEPAAALAVALRYSAGIALFSGALAGVALPLTARVRSANEFRGVLVSLRRELLTVVLAAVAAGGAAYVVIPVVFGPGFDSAPSLSVILLCEVPLLVWQVPAAFAFVALGHPAWQLQHMLLMLVTKVLLLVLLPANVYVLAASGAVAYAVGLVFVVARLLQVDRSSLNGELNV